MKQGSNVTVLLIISTRKEFRDDRRESLLVVQVSRVVS